MGVRAGLARAAVGGLSKASHVLTEAKGAILAALADPSNAPAVAWYSPRVTYLGPTEYAAQLLGYNVRTVTPSVMWRTQPHLRTVVEFLARNVAQLGLHVYERTEDGGRRRDRGSRVALTLDWLDGEMTPYDLMFAAVGDLALYDCAYWWVAQDSDSPSGWSWRRLPPSWVTPDPAATTPFRVGAYLVTIGSQVVRLPAASPSRPGVGGVVRVGGYDPGTYLGASPAVEALRETLQEQIEATKYRSQVWRRGGRVSAVIERPVDADPWSDAARESFREDWYAKFTGNGPKAGGTPILEDGMKLTRIDFNAREQQFVEAAKLTLQTVAGVFHVQPSMLGQSEGTSYSNVKEFHGMLYRDTLGPTLRRLDQRINKAVLPILGMDPARYYVEFNLSEKLSGSFEEQAAILSTSTGGAWLTRNEARARQNLPAVEGGDELIVPLNVVTGGQASPRDTGEQNTTPGAPDRATSAPRGGFRLKSPRARAKATAEVAAVLGKFFERQGRVLRTKKAPLSWDAERWDRELAEDLLGVYTSQAKAAAAAAMKANGLDPEAYNEPRTLAYLRKAAAGTAGAINTSTKDALEAALEAAEDDPDVDPYGAVFDEHAEGRANVWGASVAGFVVGFGVTEAARQAGGSKATKTWQVTSGNSRSSHAAMDGETVPVDEPFSNGLDWPGSFGDPDEVAGCQCEIGVSW